MFIFFEIQKKSALGWIIQGIFSKINSNDVLWMGESLRISIYKRQEFRKNAPAKVGQHWIRNRTTRRVAVSFFLFYFCNTSSIEIELFLTSITYVKPCFDLFQFSYNFMSKGFLNLNIDIKYIRKKDRQTYNGHHYGCCLGY